jgi:hypothetical protein
VAHTAAAVLPSGPDPMTELPKPTAAQRPTRRHPD